jgi:hypothetical protein
MSDEKKLIVDDDWKSKVEAEKEAERQKEQYVDDDTTPCPIEVIQVFPLTGGIQLSLVAESLGVAFSLGKQFPEGKMAVVTGQSMLMVVVYLGEGTQQDIMVAIARWGKAVEAVARQQSIVGEEVA